MQPDQSPLDQLADIHLPDSVSWWPLAPGWWALLALLVIALIVFFIWRHRARQNRYRIAARNELEKIYGDYQTTQNAAAFLHQTNVLLRRTALTAHPGTFNASIKGDAWLIWLDSVCPEKNTPKFNSETGQQLLTASYQKNPEVDANAIYQLAKQWLAKHQNYRRKHRQKIPARKTTGAAAEAKHV